MEEENLSRLNLLGHDGRMSVFRLLMRRYPDAVSAGEIGEALRIKPSTLSVHLSALSKRELVSMSKDGTHRRYRVRMDTVRTLSDFLFQDCCRGRPELCPPIFPVMGHGENGMSDKTYNVLFICTGNSARSVFAEAILRAEGRGRFNAFSAGTKPYSELNPFAIEMLESKGHDITPLRAKNVSEFQGPDAPALDFVFTVCDRAANEECPPWPGQPMTAHWGMPDPVRAEGTDAQKQLAFQQAYGMMRNRIMAFTSLPIDTLDRASLQSAMDRIAETSAAADA